jgi:hypothetical protein
MKTRRWLLLLAYIALIGGGLALGKLLPGIVDFQIRPINEPEIHRALMITALVFVVASAFPFVPGAEIGFGMMAVFGDQIVLLVYSCMVLSLCLAFLLGRFIPSQFLAKAFDFAGFSRAEKLVRHASEMPPAERSVYFVTNAPNRWVPFILRHRYLALMLALNTPGNTLLGGGGGLALFAGMSGLFSIGMFVIAVAVAVAPIPLLMLLN